MKGDAGVIDYLNRSLRHELTAISQYWLHQKLQDDWGLKHMAKKSREESIEEMYHADRLMEQIIRLEGHPNMQQLETLRIGQTPRETLECDLAAELEAKQLYTEAREHCRSVGDYVSMALFEEFLADEDGHIDFLETQIALHDRIGAENYARLNAVPMDEAD